MSKVITIEIECHSCGGTGLYSGMAERDGACVICSTCKGTGKSTYSYKEFKGRKPKDGCKRVYKRGMGYVISANDVETKEGTKMPFSTAGVAYEDWLDGEEPKHMEFLACPMMADQSACHNIDGFVDNCNELNGGWLSHIPSCKNECNKDECWKRFNEAQ